MSMYEWPRLKQKPCVSKCCYILIFCHLLLLIGRVKYGFNTIDQIIYIISILYGGLYKSSCLLNKHTPVLECYVGQLTRFLTWMYSKWPVWCIVKFVIGLHQKFVNSWTALEILRISFSPSESTIFDMCIKCADISSWWGWSGCKWSTFVCFMGSDSSAPTCTSRSC